MDENEKILSAMSSSIFEPLPDVGMDYLEIGLDSLLEAGPLQEIPIVKTLVSVCKIGMGWHERNMLRQLFAFIQELNSGAISPEQLKEHKEKIEQNSHHFKEELGRITTILNGQIDLLQSKVLGAMYRSYISQEFGWDKFCELAEANRRMFVSDYRLLAQFYQFGLSGTNVTNMHQIDRLISIGLLHNENRIDTIKKDTSNYEESYDLSVSNDCGLTVFGREFCQASSSVLLTLSE